ncbi:hypothetical protein RD792_011856 [Penstemon davidsonii]|uniref:peptidylprolyl isomerase n=1 Tax=Penstemon davidsonii TaxID=160366 RepID=A0ABR0CWP4_9LAMI|nr:hypothetical protein RD792_011856 [Penstemon davidsonii]
MSRRKKITPGSLMKALIRPGAGEKTPTDGDQLIYHCTIRTLDGVVVESTRAEYGGNGTPKRQVLGKSKILLGLLEGIPTMLKGEVAMVRFGLARMHFSLFYFKVKPELHYGEDECPLSVADGFPKDDELHFEIELIDFSKVKARMLHLLLREIFNLPSYYYIIFPTAFRKLSPKLLVSSLTSFMVITEDLAVLKKVMEEGQGWEQPREPYEVKAWISGKSGDGKIPKGLEMGIGTMSRGEKAVIYVKKEYLTQCPLIPSIEGIDEAHFEVELVHFVQVRDVLGDGRLIKRRLRDGRGEFPMDCPLLDSLLHVHYKGMLLNEENTVFYDTRVDNNGQPLEFRSGEGLVPEGFEMCTRLMLPGEIALVTCPPDYAYDKFARPAEVPQGSYIQWEIELLDYEKQKDWTGFSFREIMDDVEKIKGTVLREFNHVNPQDDEEGKEFSDTRNMLHLNVAACLLKMGEVRKSIEACNKVLDTNPVHVKALYRRGMAYMTAGDFGEARADFNKMMTTDKSSESTAKAALLKLKKEEQEIHRRAREQFKGLFDKKPGEIAEAGDNDLGENVPGETTNEDDREGLDTEKERLLEATAPPPSSLWSRLWPSGRRFFRAFGLDRCAIL